MSGWSPARARRRVFSRTASVAACSRRSARRTSAVAAWNRASACTACSRASARARARSRRQRLTPARAVRRALFSPANTRPSGSSTARATPTAYSAASRESSLPAAEYTSTWAPAPNRSASAACCSRPRSRSSRARMAGWPCPARAASVSRSRQGSASCGAMGCQGPCRPVRRSRAVRAAWAAACRFASLRRARSKAVSASRQAEARSRPACCRRSSSAVCRCSSARKARVSCSCSPVAYRVAYWRRSRPNPSILAWSSRRVCSRTALSASATPRSSAAARPSRGRRMPARRS